MNASRVNFTSKDEPINELKSLTQKQDGSNGNNSLSPRLAANSMQTSQPFDLAAPLLVSLSRNFKC